MHVAYDGVNRQCALHVVRRKTKNSAAQCLTGQFGNAMLHTTPNSESVMVAVFALTTVTDNTTFLPKWISHYSELIGAENLYVFNEGQDLESVGNNDDVNILGFPSRPSAAIQSYQRKSDSISNFVGALLESYDVGIVTNVDEYLILDPNTREGFKSYIGKIKTSTASALGLEVARNLQSESALRLETPLLQQRHYARISSNLTKPVIVKEPVTWTECMRKIRGKNFNIDPNLFLFKFGNLDQDKDCVFLGKTDRQHLTDDSDDRVNLLEEISYTQPIDGDKRFDTARREQFYYRNILKWNEPGRLRRNKVIKIPRRFEDSV
jgi:hypothetical protein